MYICALYLFIFFGGGGGSKKNRFQTFSTAISISLLLLRKDSQSLRKPECGLEKEQFFLILIERKKIKYSVNNG